MRTITLVGLLLLVIGMAGCAKPKPPVQATSPENTAAELDAENKRMGIK